MLIAARSGCYDFAVSRRGARRRYVSNYRPCPRPSANISERKRRSCTRSLIATSCLRFHQVFTPPITTSCASIARLSAHRRYRTRCYLQRSPASRASSSHQIVLATISLNVAHCGSFPGIPPRGDRRRLRRTVCHDLQCNSSIVTADTLRAIRRLARRLGKIVACAGRRSQMTRNVFIH